VRYHALVTDYDSTIAEHGLVRAGTIRALEQVRASGRKLVLVTGRQLEDLLRVFTRLDLFDRVIAENGAVLYCPETREERILAEAEGPEFVRALQEAGITPLSEGKVIVSTQRPNETKILEIIRDMGLELHVIFNQSAVMVLPSGVNKASGMKAGLHDIGLSAHNCVGVGDAENDHAFLAMTECSVAVSNAIEALKKKADYVTKAEAGDGVAELIDLLLTSDLQHLPSHSRHRIPIGLTADNNEASINAYGSCVLIAGPSGSGKSTIAHGVIEKLSELGYQFCIVDPEGDYLNEVMKLLAEPSQSVTVNLLGIPLKERPTFFESLLHGIQEMVGRTGRPHWLIIDETHHVLPSPWKLPDPKVPEGGMSVMMITVEASTLPESALQLPDVFIAVGEAPDHTLETFCHCAGYAHPPDSVTKLAPGEAVAWFCKTGERPFWFRANPPKSERQRHRRKYAEGELPPELSFYFHGPENKLNLRAQNLTVFLQTAEGLDEATWSYHLKEGDISHWFRTVIKDPELADEAAKFENGAPSADSRSHILAEIRKRYIVA
jgi:HAD superfamily hydrolase (TIGR01484 family)